MYERTRTPSSGCHGYKNVTAKMANDIGPRKTMFVLVIVVGCFAILWPKVFYPMLVGSANQHMKPSPIDKTTGCCDVFSEVDINTIKIMSELCSSIVEQSGEKALTGKAIVARCKAEVQHTCGIDISSVLDEQFRFGRSVKQILSEVRSLNGSLCLKYHYGVAPWRLGVPHRITVNFTTNVRQERPPHLRPDIVHPAFRERGSAIPRPPGTAKRAPKIVEGRPGPLPGMRPTLGGGGHAPPSQKTGSSMSVIMPIYTIGIVIFFTYTLMKLLFKKQPDGVGGSLYPPVDPDPRFRKEVFESERCRYTPRLSRDPTGKIVVNAMSALLDEVDEEIAARRKPNRLQVPNQAKSVSDHSLANGNLANGSVSKQHDQEQTSVKILGMETTASCEGGEKWSKPVELIVPVPHAVEPPVPPQEIYLQGALPAQSQILVSDSAVVTETAPNDTNSDPAVVLAGKMTLSVISIDSAHDIDKTAAETEAASVGKEIVEALDLNGDLENTEEDGLEESKYTTASSATVAENEISEGTDNEMDEDVEMINDLEFEVNHIGVPNGAEAQQHVEKGKIEELVLDVEAQEIVAEEIQNIDTENIDKIEEIEIIQNEEIPIEEIKIDSAASSTTQTIDTDKEAEVKELNMKIEDTIKSKEEGSGGIQEVAVNEPQKEEIQPLVTLEVEEKNIITGIGKLSVEETEVTGKNEIEVKEPQKEKIQQIRKLEVAEEIINSEIEKVSIEATAMAGENKIEVKEPQIEEIDRITKLEVEEEILNSEIEKVIGKETEIKRETEAEIKEPKKSEIQPLEAIGDVKSEEIKTTDNKIKPTDIVEELKQFEEDEKQILKEIDAASVANIAKENVEVDQNKLEEVKEIAVENNETKLEISNKTDDKRETEAEIKEPQKPEIEPLTKLEVEATGDVKLEEIKTTGNEIKPTDIVEELKQFEEDKNPILKETDAVSVANIGKENVEVDQNKLKQAKEIAVENNETKLEEKVETSNKTDENRTGKHDEKIEPITKESEMINDDEEMEEIEFEDEDVEIEEIEVEDDEDIEIDDDEEIEEIEIEVEEDEDEEVIIPKTKE